MNKLSACNPLSKAPKNEVRLLCDEAMSARIREAQAVAELKDTKQRVMEMETQVLCSNILSFVSESWLYEVKGFFFSCTSPLGR